MITAEKQEVRTRFLGLRKALSIESVENRSYRILQRCRTLITKDIHSVMFYVPINREVDLLPLARELIKEKMTVLFPKVMDINRIVACPVKFFEQDFKKGAFNIPEPDTEVYEEPIDLVFVPGIAFGRNGYRIGYGRSFYDRFLYSGSARFSAGVCYDFQLIPTVPHTENDYRLHQVITESESVQIKKESFI